MRYAEVSDLEARTTRPMSDDERAVASALLDDASAMLTALAGPPEDDDRCALMTMVACNMVQRAMSATDAGLFGVTQSTMTAGPYTQSQTYSNPAGDMYLTKTEKRMLGVSQGYIGSIRPMIGRHDHDPWR